MTPSRWFAYALVAVALLIPFWAYVEKHSGNIPYPAKHLWDFACFVGVFTTGNIHQPSMVGIFLGFFVIFFLPVALVGELIHLVTRIVSPRR